MCDHRLFSDPDGMTCVITEPHATHRYEAADAPDRHTDERDQEGS